MPKTFEGNPSDKSYWEHRVRTAKNLDDAIFLDGRRAEYWRRVRQILSSYAGCSALDVCCGFGRFSEHFTDYLGVDFSEEMLKLARKFQPGKQFVLADVREYIPDRKWDIIFEVNSCRSLGLSHEDFINKFKKYAAEAVIVLEADRFVVEQLYPN